MNPNILPVTFDDETGRTSPGGLNPEVTEGVDNTNNKLLGKLIPDGRIRLQDNGSITNSNGEVIPQK